MHQAVKGESLSCELSDRDQRPIYRDRSHRDIDARAVEQAGVHHWLRLVDPAPYRRYDLIDDTQQMRFVAKQHRHFLQLSGALDVDVLMGIYQHIAYGRVLEERFDWTKPHHLIEQFIEECFAFLGIDGQTLAQDVLRDEIANELAQLSLGRLVDR